MHGQQNIKKTSSLYFLNVADVVSALLMHFDL